MEYLMTYSWAILVVLVVGLVLWQMGVFNQGQGNTITTGFPQLKPLSATMVYQQNGSFQASFTNTLGTPILITNISMGEVFLSENCTGVIVNDVLPPANATISAGNAATIKGTCPVKQREEAYQVYISVDYNVMVSGNPIRHLEDGTVSGTAE